MSDKDERGMAASGFRRGRQADATATIVCTLVVRADSVVVQAAVERSEDGFRVLVDGEHVEDVRRAGRALREVVLQIRRRLGQAQPQSWGVLAKCWTTPFILAYGDYEASPAASPAVQPECVQRAIHSSPPWQAGVEPALEHAERTLDACCGLASGAGRPTERPQVR
jgi:hypothetical protein